MRIVHAKIMNYRSIKQLDFKPSTHNVLIGRVNSGKSTLLNALSLVLDPDVGRRYRPVEELDFFEGTVLDDKKKPIPIIIEVTLSHCSEEERNYFLEFMWGVRDVVDYVDFPFLWKGDREEERSGKFPLSI